MKTTIITEFVKFKALETTSDEQLISKADLNAWCFIFHYESLDQIMAVGEKLRKSKEFGEFIPLIVPQSISASFHKHLKKW